MKKLLSMLSAFTISASVVLPVVSCASKSLTAHDVVPKSGWPPFDKKFLKIWDNFTKQVQADLSKNMGKMFDQYSNEYIGVFDTVREENYSKRNKPGFDEYGVSNDDSDKILNDVGRSQAMIDYVKDSLRLYYSQIKTNELNGQSKFIAEADEVCIWSMKYFRSFPFYNSVQIHLNDPSPVIHQVAINFNYYDIQQYIQTKDGYPRFDLPPDPAMKPDNFHPIFNIREEYYPMVDLIYNELFGKGN